MNLILMEKRLKDSEYVAFLFFSKMYFFQLFPSFSYN